MPLTARTSIALEALSTFGNLPSSSLNRLWLASRSKPVEHTRSGHFFLQPKRIFSGKVQTTAHHGGFITFRRQKALDNVPATLTTTMGNGARVRSARSLIQNDISKPSRATTHLLGTGDRPFVEASPYEPFKVSVSKSFTRASLTLADGVDKIYWVRLSKVRGLLRENTPGPPGPSD